MSADKMELDLTEMELDPVIVESEELDAGNKGRAQKDGDVQNDSDTEDLSSVEDSGDIKDVVDMEDGGDSNRANEYELWVNQQREQSKAILEQLMSNKSSVLPTSSKKSGRNNRITKARVLDQEPRRSKRVMVQAACRESLESHTDPAPLNPAKNYSPEPKTPKLRVDGKRFGAIPGVSIGDVWEFRIKLGAAGVHPPPVGGIFGGPESGAYSVVLSAGYPEDVDEGDKFTYTGAGGRELKRKNLRTATQSKDQELVRGNAGLHKSFQTGNPVRVVRGYKNPLGPETGYRYDGLYKVVNAYTAKSQDGKFLVWQFDFEKIPGQKTVNYHAKEIKSKNETADTNAEAGPSPPATDGEDDISGALTSSPATDSEDDNTGAPTSPPITDMEDNNNGAALSPATTDTENDNAGALTSPPATYGEDNKADKDDC
ncbi:PUA-like domain-containing protein [Tricharina praecox]|uniref:PUA-like domain-containing protein n=1 Tax=Tricharina praecox TaxID=43433 RepID=UPI00221E9AAE|nr:PUA-like domain-containing protein [Tricharina praecox]KAI5855751.1 PUA-like domain-containing protein [Tricharina praecox]